MIGINRFVVKAMTKVDILRPCQDDFLYFAFPENRSVFLFVVLSFITMNI